MSHEILLMAVRSEDDCFDDDLSLRIWIAAPRDRHSEKPDAVRNFLARANPGPRLEIYARQIPKVWLAWGHEIAEPLTEQAASFNQPGINDQFFKKRPLARRLYLQDHQGDNPVAADRLRLLARTRRWGRSVLQPAITR
jgi:hypothetical protein